MSVDWGFVVDSDDDDVQDEGSESKAFIPKKVTLLLIDSTPDMFQPWKDGEDEIPFRTALKCCQAILRRKILSNDKTNLISILFIGTKESRNSSNFENIYQLGDLSPVKVEIIEKLNAMKDSEDYDGFTNSIGSSDEFSLKEVFWLTKIIIDEGKATHHQKRIIFFTKNDSPLEGRKNAQAEVVKKFKDMGKVTLTVVGFSDYFNGGNFYETMQEEGIDVIEADNLENLMKTFRVKERGRRPISKTTFEITPGIKMGVGFYSFARPSPLPKAVNVNIRTGEEVVKSVSQFRKDSGMPVLKSEERKMIVVQGEQAVFSTSELKKIKQGHDRGISLLGFMNGKDFDYFAWYRSPGYFLYPEEELITGSKNLFAALMKRCASMEKIPIVKMVLTRSQSAKLACLIPSVNDPLFPQGFHVFPIPFCDEMRQYDDFDFPNAPSAELVQLVQSVIKKTTNKRFDILEVSNPLFQHRWRELEREALDITEDDQEEFHDYTEPNEDLMIQRLGDLPERIEAEIGGFSTQKSSTPIFKQVDMAMEVKNKRVDKLTVPVLKDFLQSHSVPCERFRKAELVAAVYEYFNS